MHISLTPRALLRMLIVWALTAFFFLSGAQSIAPFAIAGMEHVPWSYPDGFRYLAALLEFAAALFITTERTRPSGAAAGALAMAPALLMLLIRAQFALAAMPAAVLIGLLGCLRLDAKAREIRWECKVF